MATTRKDLLGLVYRFYPRGVMHIDRMYVPAGEPFYEDTEEHLRLVAAANRGRAEYPTWKAMMTALKARDFIARYSIEDESMFLLAGGTDPAYSGRIWVTDKATINFHVSLLGPYYGMQLPGVPEEEPVARAIREAIEATYPGYETIPPEIGNEVVPDVDAGLAFGTATIYLAIFSEFWPRVYRNVPLASPAARS